MLGRRIQFTIPTLNNLPIPTVGRDTWTDTKATGLQLRVTPTGVKTFSWFRRSQGSGAPERITLGRWPDMSIETAREHVARLNAEIADGGSPATQRREQRNEMTFAEMFEIYMTRWAKIRKKTWKDDEGRFRIHLIDLHSKRLSDISKRDIALIHNRVGKKNPITANRVIELLSKIFNVANDFGLFAGGNPTKGIKSFPEKSRDRFLSGEEIQNLIDSLTQEKDQVRNFFLLALFTGARRANVLAMRWDQINLIRQVWTIPETKNGRPVIVPLVPIAVEILTAIRDGGNDSEWVFPASNSKTGHFVEPRKAWERVTSRAGIDGARIHDLRRTMGSWQAITGASLPIIGKSLGHQSQQATAIYARLDLDPVRAAMETAVAAMMGKK
ncbi:MAG: tyrosine-type recombinase/integrase [Magnetococcales bacterium]|nr:tyrosine-type recombinase/integrase [Magnetococcales bacterium]